ncbi:MAG TPA: hypothetical protein V6D14_27800 [Coleofasciculaceae cyanobacterium]
MQTGHWDREIGDDCPSRTALLVWGLLGLLLTALQNVTDFSVPRNQMLLPSRSDRTKDKPQLLTGDKGSSI